MRYAFDIWTGSGWQELTVSVPKSEGLDTAILAANGYARLNLSWSQWSVAASTIRTLANGERSVGMSIDGMNPKWHRVSWAEDRGLDTQAGRAAENEQRRRCGLEESS